MNMGRLFRRNYDVFAAPLEDTTLLLNTDTGTYHGLNPVATRIWELLAEPTDEELLVRQLSNEFEITPEDCLREVTVFLNELRERKLLVDA
jgi:hypothetical protein